MNYLAKPIVSVSINIGIRGFHIALVIKALETVVMRLCICRVYAKLGNLFKPFAAETEEAAAEKKTEMGRKYIVPYGLYRCEGFISANLARKTTGFSEEDLSLLWQAIINMFELDHSAARGKMAVRELIVFKHDSEFGNAPAHKLFDLVKVTRKDDSGLPARAYTDYEVSVNETALPAGVTCTRMI